MKLSGPTALCPADLPIYTLHRYFIAASQMRANFYNPALHNSSSKRWSPVPAMYGSYWFAALYILVEGWKELSCQDIRIDNLMEPDKIDRLRKLRNTIFHYQKKYYDERLFEFFEHCEEMEAWSKRLHDAFNDFFIQWGKSKHIPIRYKQTIDGRKEVNYPHLLELDTASDVEQSAP